MMKRVFAVALAILLLAGCLSIPTMASDEVGSETGGVSVSLYAANLEFAEYLYLWAGIHLDGVEYDSAAKNAGVIFWREEQAEGGYTYEKAKTAAAAGKAVISDVACVQETYNGVSIIGFPCSVAAKQMADVFYLQGYVKVGDKYYYSDKIEPYSVVQYAKAQLFRNQNAGDELKECLLAMLDYGATAQKLFKYNTDNLANKIYSEGLKFSLQGNGTCYVSDIGTCTDTEILIPYNSPDGYKVVGISSYAFQGCRDITSVTIPTSITSINYAAFQGCTGLKSVTIPGSVTYIGSSAFSGCYGLKSVTIPGSVTSIDSYAFCNCYGLGSVTIPGSVTSIDSYAFCNCYGLGSVTISEGVTSIGSEAFGWCSGLKSITIPSSVTSMAGDAFYRCYNLESIQVDAENEVYYSDGNCLIETKSKTLVVGCENSVIPDGVTKIGDDAFSGISGSITIPNSVTSIGDRAFYNCGVLNITIPDSVTSIGAEAFSYGAFTSIEIPKSVRSIGSGAFTGCWNLRSIKVAEGNSAYHATNNCLIETASKTLMARCNGSTIPADGSVTSIGYQAFMSCDISTITIPDKITSIGDYAFAFCNSLTSITIPDSVTSIGDCAFYRCEGLTSITIPDSVTSIGTRVFAGTPYYSDDTNWEDGVLYIGNHLIEANSSISGAYSIKSGTKCIAGQAFYWCSDLTSITIPNSVTSIGDYAFYWCCNLESITLPDSVTKIGTDAFYYTGYYWDNANWENGALYIGNHLIVVDPSTTGAYSIKTGTKSIADSAFAGCAGITSITIPDSITSIGDLAFYGCSGLTNVTINGKSTSIGGFTLPSVSSLASIGERAFSECSSLELINYTGKKANWSAITKGTDWDLNTGSYTVSCTDGDITK